MLYRICFIFFLTVTFANAQSAIIGKWKTIDDQTGKERSIVEIYKKGNKVFGKIIRVLKESDRSKTCIYCSGSDYNKPIEGLEIIKNMEPDGSSYEDGTITDPENGKTYRCKLWIDDDNPDILNVRGYIAFFYRTQQWQKL